MGVYFVSFVGHHGYDRLLSVLGRHMRDFLNGLDNLHEYLKFSYPRMKAPSFFCERETSKGLTLHYRSTRKGFLWYTIGQIKVNNKSNLSVNKSKKIKEQELYLKHNQFSKMKRFLVKKCQKGIFAAGPVSSEMFPFKGNLCFPVTGNIAFLLSYCYFD